MGFEILIHSFNNESLLCKILPESGKIVYKYPKKTSVFILGLIYMYLKKLFWIFITLPITTDLQRVAVGFWDPYQSLAIGLKEIESPYSTMINSLSPMMNETLHSLFFTALLLLYYGVFRLQTKVNWKAFINISDSSISSYSLG